MSKLIDLTGMKFGRLTVLEKLGKNKDNRYMYKCICECGNYKNVSSKSLKNGGTKSCGCLVHEKRYLTKRGYNIRLYNTWCGIKERCFRKTAPNYKNYGGRGITMCKEWKDSYSNFYDWAMSHGYNDNLTIDRIDVNGNYEPSNCRWATPKTQANNRRSNHIITFNGKSQTIQQWADETGIKHTTILERLKRGWNIEKALSISPEEIKNNSCKKVLCITTGEIFESMREACRYYNIDRKTLSMCCRGEFKTCGNKQWRFV